MSNNIYKGSVGRGKYIYRDYNKSWDNQLDEAKKYYNDRGYVVVFVFVANSFQDIAEPILYIDAIPLVMQKYRDKYVRFNGHWVIENSLGTCDKCGNYESLIALCDKGWLCKECAKEEW